SRAPNTSSPLIFMDPSSGVLSSRRIRLPSGITTSAPLPGAFPSGQLVGSDQSDTLSGWIPGGCGSTGGSVGDRRSTQAERKRVVARAARLPANTLRVILLRGRDASNE